MKLGSVLRASAVAMTAALALTACGDGGTASSVEGGAVGASVEDADRDAHLRVGHTVAAVPLHPHRMTSSAASFPYMTPVYDRLVQLVPNEGSLELEPMLATEWEFSEDGTEFDVVLREGVTFSDGAPVDADAVKASIDGAMAEGSTVASYFTMLDSVEVVDPTHVKFIVNRPAADLPYVLAGVEASIVSPEALENPDLDVNPVGSGPYVATSVNVGDSVTYERRDGYWDEDAQLAQTITLRGITDDNAMLNALQSGQIDLAFANASMYDRISQLGPGFSDYQYPPSQVYTALINVDRPALDDKLVRQALNYAIDRDGINQSLLNGLCEPTDQLLTEGVDGHLSEPSQPYTYDPEKARELLAEAGAENAEIEGIVTAGLSPQTEIAAALQAQFAEVGITMNQLPMDRVESVGVYGSGGSDALTNIRVYAPTPAQTLNNNYGNDRVFPGTLPDGFRDAIASALDPNASQEEQTAAIEEANGIANEEAFDVYVCGIGGSYAFTDRVIGVDNMGAAHYLGIMDLRYVGLAS